MIALACDHSALELKKTVMAYLDKRGISYRDFGTYTEESCAYPVFGARAARSVAAGECDRGIVICGTGIGISLAANKIPGIRCVVCSEPYSAKMARAHNNANMLAFGARVIGPELALMITEAFLDTDFEGGRHAARVDMISALERGESIE